MVIDHTCTKPNDPDAQLMLDVKNGDEEAFEELVNKYEQRLVRTIAYMMGTDSQAHDLTQRVFLSVYRSRSTYEPAAKFSTWLLTIMRNVVFSAQRASNRELRSLEHCNQSDWALLKVDANGPEQIAIQVEMRQSVRQALLHVRANQQQAIILVYFHGLSYREASDQMGVTVPAMKQLLHRGKVQLKSILEKQHCLA